MRITKSIRVAHAMASPKTGRGKAFGSRMGTAKLTEADVLSIRNRWKGRGKGPTMKELAEEFSVGFYTVRSILRGMSWSHV